MLLPYPHLVSTPALPLFKSIESICLHLYLCKIASDSLMRMIIYRNTNKDIRYACSHLDPTLVFLSQEKLAP